jgi:hypothetical protein
MALGSITGASLLIADMKFGFLTTLLAGIPSIIVIAFISGLISGDISGGTVAGLLSGAGGVLGSLVLSPFVFPEWGPPPPDLPSQIMWALGSSIAQSSFAAIQGLGALLAALGAILSILITIILFGVTTLAGAIGGIIGRILGHLLKKSPT